MAILYGDIDKETKREKIHYNRGDVVSSQTVNDIQDTAIDAHNMATEALDKADSVFQGNGTVVSVGGTQVGTLSFKSDPQQQIDTLNSKIGSSTGSGTIVKFGEDPQSEVIFDSNPQEQIDTLSTTISNNDIIYTSNMQLNAQHIATLDSNKADKVGGATANNLASLDASGNLQDSGININNDGYMVIPAGKRIISPAGNLVGAEADSNTTLVGNVNNPIRLNGTQYRPDYHTSVDYVTRPLALLQDANYLSMLPSDSRVWLDLTASNMKAGVTFFTAPTNGVAYIRYASQKEMNITVELRTASDYTIGWNTQYGIWCYSVTFVMKAGQKLYCYENSGTYNWGQLLFVNSQTI